MVRALVIGAAVASPQVLAEEPPAALSALVAAEAGAPFERPPGWLQWDCPSHSSPCVPAVAGPRGGRWRPDYCCCNFPLRCWDGDACALCPGSLARWRSAAGRRADMLMLGLLVWPRLTSLLCLASGAWPDARLSSEAWDWMRARENWESGGELSARAVRTLWPHWPLLATLLPAAADSFWWVLAFVYTGVSHLLTDAAMAMLLLTRRQLPASWLLQQNISAIIFALTVAAALALDYFDKYPCHLSNIVLRLVCGVYSVLAMRLPARLRRFGQHTGGVFGSALRWLALGSQLCFLVALARWSHNAVFDCVTSALMLWPGAVALLELQGMVSEVLEELRRGTSIDQYSMSIDRARVLESSVEELAKLPPKAFESGVPYVRYVRAEASSSSGAPAAGGGGPAACAEDGVDAGGLGRDWLNRAIAEAFDPASGLVETTTIDGTAYARLSKGADLAKLEAVGKVMGLALRAGQPLGVDLCRPLAHLLAHQRLPEVLARVSAGLGGGAGASAAPAGHDEPESSPVWQRLRRLRRRLQSGKKLAASTELLLVGFSREWLRWVSAEEYAWLDRGLEDELPAAERAAMVEAWCLETPAGEPVTLQNLPQHMAARALDELLLGVRAETLALWRGLRSIPRVPLPRLSLEAHACKRERQALEEEKEARAAKRGRPEGREAPEEGEEGRAVKRKRLEGGEASGASAEGVTAPGTPEEGASKKRRLRSSEWDAQELGGAEGPADYSAPSAGSAAKRRRLSMEHSILQQEIAGDPTISVEQWKQLTRYDLGPAGLASSAQRTIGWFWAHVGDLGTQERADLLAWITGFRRLPAGGFPTPSKHMTISLVDSSAHLPVAHTCALQLDLPAGYDSPETLRAKLAGAMEQKEFYLA